MRFEIAENLIEHYKEEGDKISVDSLFEEMKEIMEEHEVLRTDMERGKDVSKVEEEDEIEGEDEIEEEVLKVENCNTKVVQFNSSWT